MAALLLSCPVEATPSDTVMPCGSSCLPKPLGPPAHRTSGRRASRRARTRRSSLIWLHASLFLLLIWLATQGICR